MSSRKDLIIKLLRMTAIIILLIGTGCTTRLVDFTVISTKNIDWSQAATFQRAKARVEGKDWVHIIICIPTGVPSMKEAIDRAIESVPGGVALLDGVLISKFYYIPYIYGRQTYVIEGTPLINPAFVANGNSPLGDYVVVHCDKDGNVESFKSVSKDEYEKVRSKFVARDES